MRKLYSLTILSLFILLVINNSAAYAQCAPVITGPSTVCAGTTTMYNVYATPASSNLNWSIDGGGTLNSNHSISWATPGLWTITVSNPFCPGSPTVYNVNVVDAATISAPTQITGPVSICVGNTTIYSVPAIAGLTPVWLITPLDPFVAPPTLTSTGNQVEITWPTTPGSYNLYASYTNGTCSGSQKAIAITSASGTSPISIHGNGNDKFCKNQAFTFSVYGGLGDSYTWALTGGGTLTPLQNGNQATVQWTDEGTFTLTATATNICNPTPRSASRTITVGPSTPSAPGIISKQNANTCKNQMERFSVSPVSGATSYKWTIVSPEGYFISLTTDPFFDYSFSIIGPVTATVIASNGYCDSPPSAVFSFDIGVLQMQANFPSTVCAGTTTTLSITSAGDMSGYTFLWNVGDGEILGSTTGSSISVKWNSAGNRFVFAKVTTPCGDITVPGYIGKVEVQDPSFTLSPLSGVTQACLGEYSYYSSTIPQSSAKPTLTLTLQGGGATNGGTINNYKVTWNTPGNYTLTAALTNSCGITQSQSLNVTVVSGTKPTTALINGNSLETICTDNFPITTSYSVPLTTGYSYAWELLPSSPSNTLSSSSNTATITWNQISTYGSSIRVTPFTALCSGERTYMSSTLKLNSVAGTLSSSVTSPICYSGVSIPITFELTPSTGTITYQRRKKIDNLAWSSWIDFDPSSTTVVPYDGTYPTAFGIYYHEFRVVVQNSTCSPATSNTVSVVSYGRPLLSSPATSTVCSGVQLNHTLTSGIPSTFTWVANNNPNTTGESLTSQSTGTLNDVIINNTSVVQTVTYLVTPTSITGQCVGEIRTVSITVLPAPKLSNSLNEISCSGSQISWTPWSTISVSNISWNRAAVAGITPSTATGSGNINETLTSTNSTPTDVHYVYNMLATNGCSGSSTFKVTVNPLPVLSFDPPAPSKCQGASGVPITVGGATTYTWNTAPSLTGNGATVTANPTTTTIYTCTGSTPGCPSNTKQVTVTVNPLPTPTITAPQASCFGTPATYSTQTGMSDYVWSVTGGTFTGQGTSQIVVTWSSAGSGKSVSVSYKNANGCIASSPVKLNVTVVAPPTIIPGLNPTVCIGTTTVYMNYSGATGSPTQYRIDWDNAAIAAGMSNKSLANFGSGSTPISITNITSTAGVYNGTLYVKSNSSICESSYQINVTVAATIALGVNPTVCSGTTSSTISYAGTTGSPDRYMIDWASGISDVVWTSLPAGSIPVTNIPSTPGTYTGTLFVKSTVRNCPSPGYPISVTVSSPTAVITPASSTTFCSGQTINVQLNANTGINLSYRWIKNGVEIPLTDLNATQPSYPVTEIGNYQVKVSDAAIPACSKTSSLVSVSVQTKGLIFMLGDLCEDGYVTLTVKPLSSGHVWSTGDSTNQITVYDVGTYSVQYYNSSGCLLSADGTVERIGSPCIYARMKKEDEPKVVEETKTIGVYPNPVNDQVNVQLDEPAASDLEVTLVSQFGNEVGNSTIRKGDNKATLNIKSLANGIYFVIVKSRNGFVMRQKVLVQHH